MTSGSVIWLASYPRSGNTFLRTIIYHCFGFRSASIYPADLGHNAELESYVGHIERSAGGGIRFPAGAPRLVKTHGPPRDRGRTLYIVRDGRAACVSLWEFYGRRQRLEDVIAGRHRFGSWANHLETWRPWSRPDTLLLKYEDIVGGLTSVLDELSVFLAAPPKSTRVPARSEIAGVDGRWVRPPSDWRAAMTPNHLALFDEVNGAMMKKMGYAG